MKSEILIDVPTLGAQLLQRVGTNKHIQLKDFYKQQIVIKIQTSAHEYIVLFRLYNTTKTKITYCQKH